MLVGEGEDEIKQHYKKCTSIAIYRKTLTTRPSCLEGRKTSPESTDSRVRTIVITVRVGFERCSRLIHSFFDKLIADFARRMLVEHRIHKCNFGGASSGLGFCWTTLWDM